MAHESILPATQNAKKGLQSFVHPRQKQEPRETRAHSHLESEHGEGCSGAHGTHAYHGRVRPGGGVAARAGGGAAGRGGGGPGGNGRVDVVAGGRELGRVGGADVAAEATCERLDFCREKRGPG